MQQTFAVEEVARFENATWSRCAPGYSGGFGVLTGEAIDPLLDELGVERGDRVLDLGTGPGLVAAAAARRGADVVGIDFSGAMLAEARRRHPDLEFREASAESLPFRDGAFDAVAGNFVLHHSGCPDRVLAEARRVLRPGGRAAFTVWAEVSRLAAFGLFFAAVEEHAGAAELPHGPLFGVSDVAVFRRMVREAGFRDSEVRDLDIVWRMRSIDSLLAAFRDWADLDALPRGVQAAIETTARDTARGYESADGLVIPNPAILVTAVT